MSQTDSIRVQATVGLEPERAFAVFTEDIGSWFRVTPKSFPLPTAAPGRPASRVALEPGVGGRFLAVHDGAGSGETTEVYEIGRLTVWEPGRRFVLVDQDETEVDVRFEAVDGVGTRVTLEHRGLGRLSAEHLDNAYRYGPRLMVGWYELHVDPDLPAPVGVTPYVFYRDAAAMIDWLVDVLGFEERGRFTGTDGLVHNAELRVNGTEVWLDGRSPDPWTGGDRPPQWIGVWIDDVDAMHERLLRAGVDAPPPKDENYGVRSFNVTDPEGCSWGFLRRTDNQIGVSGPS